MQHDPFLHSLCRCRLKARTAMTKKKKILYEDEREHEVVRAGSVASRVTFLRIHYRKAIGRPLVIEPGVAHLPAILKCLAAHQSTQAHGIAFKVRQLL